MTDRIASRTAARATGRAEQLLTIGRLAELTGVPVRTIPWQKEQEAFGAVLAVGAESAYTSGVAPESPQGQAKLAEILAAWARRLDRADTRTMHAKVLESMEVMSDDRVNRYWELKDMRRPAAGCHSPGRSACGRLAA